MNFVNACGVLGLVLFYIQVVPQNLEKNGHNLDRSHLLRCYRLYRRSRNDGKGHAIRERTWRRARLDSSRNHCLANFCRLGTSGLAQKQRLVAVSMYLCSTYQPKGVLMKCKKKELTAEQLEEQSIVPTYVWGRGYRVNDNDRAGIPMDPPLTDEEFAQIFPGIFRTS